MLDTSLEGGYVAEACFEYESFLLAFPQELFIFLSQRPQELVVIGGLIHQVLWAVLDGLAIGEQPGPHGGPCGMNNFLVGHICTEL